MLFLKGNVPSLKNSKVNGVFPSKSVVKYLRSLNIQKYSVTRRDVKGYTNLDKPNLFIKQVGDYFKGIEYPAIIGTHFVRDSKRRFDIINAQQIIFDLLSAHHFIDDDNSDKIIPITFSINGRYYSIDKQNPGVWICIMDKSAIYDFSVKKGEYDVSQ
jgi:hypothetical protein